MKRFIKLSSFAILAMAMAVTGCSTSSSNSETTTENTTEVTTTNENSEDSSVSKPTKEQYAVSNLPQLEDVKSGDQIATIHTNMGDIKVRFFPEYAPKAVENFETHSKEGYYNNLIFHRVINNFMIQGGDPTGTGTGGESIWGADFENEVTPNLRSFRGALCMANTGQDNSNSSQFYIVQNKDASDFVKQLEQYGSQPIADGTDITYSDIYPSNVIDAYKSLGGYPSLDFGYTIFGQVYEGMDVVDKIAAVDTDDNDKPKTDVVITGIDVGTY